jgi:hypothetical protein
LSIVTRRENIKRLSMQNRVTCRFVFISSNFFFEEN